jgi:hypothetical protein
MTPSSPLEKPAPTFICCICGESSERICAWCTKDCCELHRCEKCTRCSDCCVCDLRGPRR